jgi:hypothetical protein
MPGMGKEAALGRGGLDRPLGKARRLVELAEQQTGLTQRVVVPAQSNDDSPRRVTLEERPALSQSAQRLAPLADLREDPGRDGDRLGKAEGDASGPEDRNPVLDQEEARFRPVALEEMKQACRGVGPTNGVRVLRRLGERAGSVRLRLWPPR